MTLADERLGVLRAAGAPRRAPRRRSRSGCSPVSPPRPGWCCAVRGCAPSWHAVPTTSRSWPTSSRRRGDGVVDAHDSERRRLERDIHDGAQQHLVALVVNLSLAQTLAAAGARPGPRPCSSSRGRGRHRDHHPGRALPRDLPAGPRPRTVSPRPCGPWSARAPSRSRWSTTASAGIRQELETALYFCCVEAVQNAVKHAGARRVEVELAGDRRPGDAGGPRRRPGVRRRPRCWPPAGSATCATGSTRWAASSPCARTRREAPTSSRRSRCAPPVGVG